MGVGSGVMVVYRVDHKQSSSPLSVCNTYQYRNPVSLQDNLHCRQVDVQFRTVKREDLQRMYKRGNVDMMCGQKTDQKDEKVGEKADQLREVKTVLLLGL